MSDPAVLSEASIAFHVREQPDGEGRMVKLLHSDATGVDPEYAMCSACGATTPESHVDVPPALLGDPKVWELWVLSRESAP